MRFGLHENQNALEVMVSDLWGQVLKDTRASSLLSWITHSGWRQLPHHEDKQLYGAVHMASCQTARIHLTGWCVSHLVGGSPRLLKSSNDCWPGSILTPIQDRPEPDHLGCTLPLACSLACSKAKNSISQMHLHHAFYGTWIQIIRKIHVRLRKQKWVSQGGDHLPWDQIL